MEEWQKAAVERGYPWQCSCGEMHRTESSARACRKCRDYLVRFEDRDPPRDLREVADAEAEGGEQPTQDLGAMRREYAARRAHACYNNAARAAFDAACRAIVGEGATPEQWLAATDRATFRCGRCAGTGRFITGLHNGQPTGPGGPCFRCEGRGWQSWQDGRRNAYYNARSFGRAAHAMVRGAA